MTLWRGAYVDAYRNAYRANNRKQQQVLMFLLIFDILFAVISLLLMFPSPRVFIQQKQNHWIIIIFYFFSFSFAIKIIKWQRKRKFMGPGLFIAFHFGQLHHRRRHQCIVCYTYKCLVFMNRIRCTRHTVKIWKQSRQKEKEGNFTENNTAPVRVILVCCGRKRDSTKITIAYDKMVRWSNELFILLFADAESSQSVR